MKLIKKINPLHIPANLKLNTQPSPAKSQNQPQKNIQTPSRVRLPLSDIIIYQPSPAPLRPAKPSPWPPL